MGQEFNFAILGNFLEGYQDQIEEKCPSSGITARYPLRVWDRLAWEGRSSGILFIFLMVNLSEEKQIEKKS
jgi:hypothetical protein